jgi:hypothetical protein
MDISMFIQDLLNKYIINMSDLFSVNMSSASGNGNSIPPIGGGGMNGTPSPGGSGDDSSLVVAASSSNNNDEDNPLSHQPRSDILPLVMGPYKRVQWDYLDGQRIDGGYLAGRDYIFIGDYDEYRVPVQYFENIYNERGMHDSRKIYHDRGLLAGSDSGYGIGRII